jgi:hypothetical protein
MSTVAATIALFIADKGITYVRIEKPKLDIVGVILGAFGLTATLAVLALVIGVVGGVVLVVRRRREPNFHPGPGLDLKGD